MADQKNPDKVVDSLRTTEGGGFPVRRPFPTGSLREVDPFLLLDHMGPVKWRPGEAIGAPEHPHKGFETVTYLLEGEMEHKDSSGHSGKLRPGDLQWMTAGSGLLHSELPSREFNERGGVMNGFQIWINLPASRKGSPPRYQEIPKEKIPVLENRERTAFMRLLAGKQSAAASPIQTQHPALMAHLVMGPDSSLPVTLSPMDRIILYVIRGSTGTTGSNVFMTEGQMAMWDPDSTRPEEWSFSSNADGAEALLLSSPPIGEPVARYGPFVMNTMDEIKEAIEEYRSGKWGQIA